MSDTNKMTEVFFSESMEEFVNVFGPIEHDDQEDEVDFFKKIDTAVDGIHEATETMTHEQYVEAMNTVIENCTTLELLDQTIEETAELLQALVKLKRAIIGTTPVTEEQAVNMIAEECSDVNLCMVALGIDLIEPEHNPKAVRWADRVSR